MGHTKRRNIVAEALSKMFPQQCFPVCARKKHLLRQQNVSENVQKHFLFLGNKKQAFPQLRANGETFRTIFPQQCFLNNEERVPGCEKRFLGIHVHRTRESSEKCLSISPVSWMCKIQILES